MLFNLFNLMILPSVLVPIPYGKGELEGKKVVFEPEYLLAQFMAGGEIMAHFAIYPWQFFHSSPSIILPII